MTTECDSPPQDMPSWRAFLNAVGVLVSLAVITVAIIWAVSPSSLVPQAM